LVTFWLQKGTPSGERKQITGKKAIKAGRVDERVIAPEQVIDVSIVFRLTLNEPSDVKREPIRVSKPLND